MSELMVALAFLAGVVLGRWAGRLERGEADA